MITRRTFLKSAAAAPVAFVRPARAIAANDRVTLGFIGLGIMGRNHLGDMLGPQQVEVVAVCDVVKERLDAAKELVEKRYADRTKSGAFAGCKAYTDFRDLLARKDIDAVIIATPDHWHAIPSVLAARAGKHVYCEKPLTHNVAEGRWLVEEVAKAKVVLQTGSQQRSELSRDFRKAVDYVRNGRIGKLKTIRIGVGGPCRPCDLPTQDTPEGTDWDFWLGPAPERGYNEILCPKGIHKHFPLWRNYQEYAGGMLADMGAYHFDIAQWAMKTDRSGPVEVIPPENPKRGRGLRFVYASGVVMIHDEFEKGKDGEEIKDDCVFEGTEGIIVVGRKGLVSLPDTILKEPLGETDEWVYTPSNHKVNWLECIQSGKEPVCPVEVGHRSASICHLGNIGYRLGRKLKWDLTKEQFIGDAAANKELTREPRAKWKDV